MFATVKFNSLSLSGLFFSLPIHISPNIHTYQHFVSFNIILTLQILAIKNSDYGYLVTYLSFFRHFCLHGQIRVPTRGIIHVNYNVHGRWTCRNFLLLARFIYRKTTKFCKFHSFVISLSETMYECRYNVRKTWKKVYIKISSYGTLWMSQCAIYESIKDS